MSSTGTIPKIIVLDDDPTGSQTVHGCLLLTRWGPGTLRRGLNDPSPLFFILTNTRGMTPRDAGCITREVCCNLREALAAYDEPWLVVSRSDSTLRGHYPVETDIINAELGPFDAHFLTPQFFEGGRITRDGMHYVVSSAGEVPAHETPFARDAVFGYSTAYLPDYVEEKTAGRIRSRDVTLLGLDLDDETLALTLDGLHENACVAVSAETSGQMDRFAAAALAASARGKRFLFRSAASLLTSLAGLPPQPVPAEEMGKWAPSERPGLVLVGSHVPLSTAQLNALLSNADVAHHEIDVTSLPDGEWRDSPVPGQAEDSAVAAMVSAHAAGKSVVISTSRSEHRFDSVAARLAFGGRLSGLLMRVVQRAPETLGFIVSKGGITSNDVLSTGLGLIAARVVGQVHPGCSVVLTPEDHPHGSIPVVIFPGNVGNEKSLLTVFRRISGSG